MEPTVYSIGRGTELQFQIYGHPEYRIETFLLNLDLTLDQNTLNINNVLCYGKDLSNVPSPKK